MRRPVVIMVLMTLLAIAGMQNGVAAASWTGSITSFSASRTEVHANDRTATVTMSIDPSIYGTPYVMSIYDETNTLVRSCTYPYTSACSINSTPPNNGTKSYRAYVAQDAPTTGPPTVDVRASSRAVFVSSMDVSVEVASLALAAPLMIDPCVELFPVGPASSPPSSLNELQKQCETARAAGTPWPTVIQNLVNGFGAGIVIAASVAAHDGGPQVGAPPRTSPNPAPPQAPPQSEPPAFDPAFINGGGARLLARTRVTGYEYIADPTPENSARKVFAQCVRLATWATSGITRADCETKPIFAPGYDVTEAAQHDFDVIWRAPRTVRLNALTREEKGNSGVLSGWYNRAPYDTPDLCPAPRPTSTDCDEYPFYSSREGGPDAGGPGTLLPQQLRIIDRGQNQLEGRLLGAFYTVCGVTDPPQGSPQREYLVVPMPVQTQIPTTGYCKGG